jgi:hypothetical protein
VNGHQKLPEERTTIPCSIPFFGSNFVGEGALRLVRPDNWWIEGNWWLFPPLRVFSGNYGWPIERINQDEATELFLGAALSSALDDILYGTGPLTSSHLPEAPMRDEAERMAINRHLKEFTGLPLGWTALQMDVGGRAILRRGGRMAGRPRRGKRGYPDTRCHREPTLTLQDAALSWSAPRASPCHLRHGQRTGPFGPIDFDFLTEERAWRPAVGDVKVVAGAGQRDEQQAAFPLQILRIGHRVVSDISQR